MWGVDRPKFAEIVAASLLAGELSMGAAIASGEFVGSPRNLRSQPPEREHDGTSAWVARFRPKERATPAYDAIVIGAGIGGLMCANLLAGGARVLLVEQHYMVGGYCSTFRRKGYTFDAATHFYPLLGNPQTMTGQLLRDLGMTTGWIKMDPVDHFHFPDGSLFAVPADFEPYLGQLKAAFPEEAHALDDFLPSVKRAYLLGLLYYFRGRDTAQLNAYRDLTVQQVLDRYFRHPKLKLLLTADCPHWGSPPSRTSFVFDSMLRLSYFLGNYYPQGGSQAFLPTS